MLTFVALALIFAVVATVVTWRAIANAPEGYEDEDGFHAITDGRLSSGSGASSAGSAPLPTAS